MNLKRAINYWLKKLYNNFIADGNNPKDTLNKDILSKIEIGLKQQRTVVINYRDKDGNFINASGKINRLQLEKNLLILNALNQQIVLIPLSRINKIRILPKEAD